MTAGLLIRQHQHRHDFERMFRRIFHSHRDEWQAASDRRAAIHHPQRNHAISTARMGCCLGAPFALID
jgi:hypothetical protein